MKDLLLKLPIKDEEVQFVRLTFRGFCYSDRLLDDQHFLQDYLENLSNHKLRHDLMIISDFDVTKFEVKIKCPDKLSALQFFHDLKSLEGAEKFDVTIDNPVNVSAIWGDIATSMKVRYEHLVERHDEKIVELEEKLILGRSKSKYFSFHEFEKIKKVDETYKEKIVELKKQKTEFMKSYSLIEQCLDHYEKNNIRSEEEVIRIKRLFQMEQERFRAILPIYAHRSQIIESVVKNQVVILVGETGSGKTTQIIQYLHDVWYHSDQIIVCTQPRKVAAVSVSMRVAEEMKTKIGELVGYQVGMDKKRSQNTRLLFMTDHMLLNEYQKDKEFSKYSCIILDEAHERSIYTDLLLSFIRQTLVKRRDLRLVVTSATINPDVFVNFFQSFKPPVLKVSGRVFPVETFYEPMEGGDYVQNSCDKATSLHRSEAIPGDILVFLTSPAETELAVKKLTKMDLKNVSILPLHGQLQMSQQREVLSPAKANIRKIIFATNAAETSVTIPGICHVIDSGYVKEAVFDSVKCMTSLVVEKTTQSSADQRKGRAGRTESGKCYRLYKQEEFDAMRINSVPEIKRVHLGLAMLKIMMLGVQDPKSFDFVEAPSTKSVHAALDLLETIGATENGIITEMGKKLAVLNLEPRLGKFCLVCLDDRLGYEAIAICALSSSGNQIFYRGGSDQDKFLSDLKKTPFCDDCGDLITLLNVYKMWKSIPKHNQVKWCFENSINSKRIKGADDMINEILQSFSHQLNIWIEERFADENDVNDKLTRKIFTCFSTNISRYTGHRKMGFRLMNSPDMSLCIHPSSALNYFERPPSWVVFQSLLTTKQQFMLNVTHVKEEWIEEAMGRGELPFTQTDVDAVVLEMRQLPNVGKQLQKTLLSKNSPQNLWTIEDKMRLQDNRIITFLDLTSPPQFFLFASALFIERSFKIALDEINIMKESLSKKVLVKPIMPSSQVRFAMVCGMRVIDLLTRNDILEVDVRSGRITKQLVDELQQEGKLEFAKFFQEERKWILTFTKSYYAQTFIERYGGKSVKDYDKNLERGYHLYPVNVSLIRRPANKTSFVTFKSDIDRNGYVGCYNSISLKGTILPLKPDRNSSLSVVIFSTPYWATQEMILKEVRRHTAKVVSAKVTRLPPPTDEESKMQISNFTEDLKNALKMEASCYSLSIKDPKPKDFTLIARLFFASPEDAINAVPRLERAGLNADLDLNVTYYTPSSIYDSVKKVLDDKLNQVHVHGTIARSDKKGNNVITVIETEDFSGYEHVKQEIGPILGGLHWKTELFEYFIKRKEEVSMLSLANDTHVYFDYKLKHLVMYSTRQNIETTKNLLLQIIPPKQNYNFREVNLRNPEYPKGTMKQIILNFGCDVEKCLKKECKAENVKIILKDHIVKIEGSEESYDTLIKILNDVAIQVGNREIEDAKTIGDCPICLDQVQRDNCFVSESCGHLYCESCVKQMIKSNIEQSIIPMLCVVERCDQPFLLDDVQALITSEFSRLQHVALKVLQAKNPSCYKFCATPDCPTIFPIKKSLKLFGNDKCTKEIFCSECGLSLCMLCGGKGHHGSPCSANDVFNKKELQELQEWLNMDPSNRSTCPKCSSGIEKNGGCSHVECYNCKIHICWKCKKIFNTSPECYGHINDLHPIAFVAGGLL